MRCPVDKNDMIVVEHKKIELDYCLSCSGVWFDTMELDLLVSALQARGGQMSGMDLLTLEEAAVKEVKRKCPICGHKMDKVWLGERPKVLIDSCPAGDGLWFDGGELRQVLQQIETANPRDVLSFLGDAFKATHKTT
jgi:Zn-finger nucleic acid-binding protein